MGRAGAHGGIGLRALLVAALVSGAAAALARVTAKGAIGRLVLPRTMSSASATPTAGNSSNPWPE